MAAMRAVPLVVSALALGAAAVLRSRRERRDRDARVWAAATDALTSATSTLDLLRDRLPPLLDNLSTATGRA